MKRSKLDVLLDLCLKASRFSIKLVYETAVNDDVANYDDLKAKMADFDRNWVMTVDLGQGSSADEKEWHKTLTAANDSSSLNIFALGRKKDPSSTLYIRTLKAGQAVVSVGQINPEVVKGIWANLAFELLYLTNDDDERYSIQAHEVKGVY